MQPGAICWQSWILHEKCLFCKKNEVQKVKVAALLRLIPSICYLPFAIIRIRICIQKVHCPDYCMRLASHRMFPFAFSSFVFMNAIIRRLFAIAIIPLCGWEKRELWFLITRKNGHLRFMQIGILLLDFFYFKRDNLGQAEIYLGRIARWRISAAFNLSWQFQARAALK